MYSNRGTLYQELEALRGSKVIAYITGDRPGMETQIHHEIVDIFTEHLNKLNRPEKISLYLYSRGGNVLAGWSLVNLIRQYTNNFEVIIPARALSAATLICLGASILVMTKAATIGPIDPATNSPFNPQAPGKPPQIRLPVSVEEVAGYFELAKKEFGIKKESELLQVFLKLSDNVHPIALGRVYRTRNQIQMLAEKLLKFHMSGQRKIKKIVSKLCIQSGSHDYTISRNEAKQDLGLPIEIPDDDNYNNINEIYKDIRDELELNSPFNPDIYLGSDTTKTYSFKRGLVESIGGGSDQFISKGNLSRVTGKIDIIDRRTSEDWEHVP